MSAQISETRMADAIRESHRRQFEGGDYQKVAYDIAGDLGLDPDDEADMETLKQLESGPDPDCDCGYCETAEWLDDL